MSNKAAAILAGTAVLVGVLIGRASADTGGASNPKPKQITAQALDPKAYPRTKAGAATAAQAYSNALAKAVFGPAEQRHELVDAISTQEMRAAITKDQDEAAEGGAKLLDLTKNPEQLVARIAPLGYRVVSYTGQAARVELWSVGIVGKPGVRHGPTTGFQTQVYDLAWQRGAWRLAGNGEFKDGPGPVADNPAAAANFVASVKDFGEFDHVAR